jgi:hypothetical protein
MVETSIKFNLIDNREFHKKLENCTTSVIHYQTMKQIYKILDQPVDASINIFLNLPKNLSNKCYYPFFLREPFSLEKFDFCQFIEPVHLQQLKDKKIIPLICMVSENWELFNFKKDRNFYNSAYFNIINNLKNYGIAEEDVIWLTCNKYHKNDQRIKAKFIHFDFFLEQQKKLKNKFLPLTEIKHKYISLAQGNQRHHRYAITYMLYDSNLLSHGAVSCCDYKNFFYNSYSKITTDEYMHLIPGFNKNKFNNFKDSLPYNIDGQINLHQVGNDESHLFENIFLNIVNETHQPDNLIFITEKTYRSINYCRPFVINGDLGSLQYLKEMGFLTFDKFWDESYDKETSDHKKIAKIIDIIKYICSLDTSQLKILYSNMIPILKHNYNMLKNYQQWHKLN